ncbi:MAG TPA: hypothetical protein VEC38_06925 [Candidatus Binataceae bacterium]|nr:hypothetical protein [Candidatus Binataceae bacterium]
MLNDRWMRRALWAAAIFNLGGAFLFAFPSSSIGQLAGLSGVVPTIYRALLAMFILLFAAAYAWLARRPRIDRPLVAFSAIGKTAAFVVVAACWLLGDIPGRGVLAGSGDLAFAAFFALWLMSAEPDATSVPDMSAHGHVPRAT